MEYTIDAQGKRLGRIASEVAGILMGKNTSDFARNKIPEVKVKVINTSKIFLTSKKKSSKIYKSYSGYPGGLKEKSMKKVIADKGTKEVLKTAVKGMLPTNKLRSKMIKNLIIIE